MPFRDFFSFTADGPHLSTQICALAIIDQIRAVLGALAACTGIAEILIRVDPSVYPTLARLAHVARISALTGPI